MVEFVYEGVEENLKDMEWLKNRCILCPHNYSIAEINDWIMDLLPGEETIEYSVDTPNIHDEDDGIPVKFLIALNHLGCPKHGLPLKKEMILLFMSAKNKQGLRNIFLMLKNNIKERTPKCYCTILSEMKW